MKIYMWPVTGAMPMFVEHLHRHPAMGDGRLPDMRHSMRVFRGKDGEYSAYCEEYDVKFVCDE